MNKRFPLSWPVGIAVFYGLFAMAMIGFVVFSTFHRVELVSEDYYARELAYQEQIDREQRVRELGKSPDWVLQDQPAGLQVAFPSGSYEAGGSGSIRFYRPSNSRLDFEVPLELDPSGTQFIPEEKMARGFWRVQTTWILHNKEHAASWSFELL